MLDLFEVEGEEEFVYNFYFEFDSDYNEHQYENEKKLKENWKKIFGEILKSINEYSEDLIERLFQIMQNLDFNKNSEALNIRKKIILDIYNYSKINFGQRLIGFFEFIGCYYPLKYEDISQSINSININNINSNN